MKISIRMIVASGVLIAAVVVLLLCISSRPRPMGIANPSAVYCESLGYKYVVESTPEGERGLCQLPDGETVDAWQFLQGEVAREYSFCHQKGYEIKTVHDREKCVQFGIEKCAVCVREDGSEVEVTELMGLEFSNPGSFKVPVKLIAEAVAVIAVIVIIAILILKRKRAHSQTTGKS